MDLSQKSIAGSEWETGRAPPAPTESRIGPGLEEIVLSASLKGWLGQSQMFTGFKTKPRSSPCTWEFLSEHLKACP